MTLIEEATATLLALHELTKGFGEGSTPDPHSVLGYQSKIVDLHSRIGQAMAKKFGGKEGRYLKRKMAEAKEYRRGRIDLKKTGIDSTNDALLAVGEESQAEIDSAEEYESYRMMLKSLDNAFSHTMQTVSYVSKAESRSSSHQ